MFIMDVESRSSDYVPKTAWSLLQILLCCMHFLGRIEESHKIARKIKREFQYFHSLGSEKGLLYRS